jgi:hypothetical protein
MATGPLLEQWRNQWDDTPGGGLFDPSESTEQLDEAIAGDADEDNPYQDTIADDIGDQFDDTPGGGPVDEAREWAFNLGPDWLDEATIGVVIVVAIGALLWLARPLLTIASGVAE